MMRRLARIAVCVTVLGAAVWLWSVTSQQMPHPRRAGGDVDVRADASVPQHSATSNVAAALRLELPPMRRAVAESESRELPALRDIQLPRGSGGGAEALASDGISLWIASQFQNTVTRVRASDGKTLETVSVGSQPVKRHRLPVSTRPDVTMNREPPDDAALITGHIHCTAVSKGWPECRKSCRSPASTGPIGRRAGHFAVSRRRLAT